MDKRPWLASYPEGVPHDVDVDQYTSLTQLLEESFRQNAQRPFSVCLERWMKYRELDARSRALGAALQARGLAPGARVVIMLPNLPQFAVTGVRPLDDFRRRASCKAGSCISVAADRRPDGVAVSLRAR